jgi:hypothetical protein
MIPLDTFLAKLAEYGSNNISALEGKIQFTFNEREDLKLFFAKVDQGADRAKALEAAKAKGLDTSSWK